MSIQDYSGSLPKPSRVGSMNVGASGNYPVNQIPTNGSSMGLDSDLPLIPYYQLWFGNFLLNSFWMRYITSVEFTDSASEASSARIDVFDRDFEFSTNFSEQLAQDSEVWLYMGYEDKQRLMLHGKISDLAYSDGDDGTMMLTINVLDTSSEMNDTKKSRSWFQTTNGAVVQWIADQYGYSATVQPTAEYKEQVSQEDETDIAFMKKLADEEGYCLYVFPDEKKLWFGDKFQGLTVKGTLNYKKEDHTILKADISLVEKNKKQNVGKDGKKSKDVKSDGSTASSGSDGNYGANVTVTVDDQDDDSYVGVIGRTGAMEGSGDE